jgi:CHAT domain-containing protein
MGLTDYFVASYTSTLSSLLSARRECQPVRRSDLKMLLAAAAQPCRSWQPLPFAREDIRVIRELVPTESLITYTLHLQDSDDVDATLHDVLTHLPKTSLIHLACHGHQNPTDPLKSGFIMSDGMLSVTALMAFHLPRAIFAFLSACEMAKSDGQRPGQVIHLAATMLFAGFKSVIGTMWYVLLSSVIMQKELPDASAAGRWMTLTDH